MGYDPYKAYRDAWDAAHLNIPEPQPEPGVYGKYIKPAISHVGRFAGGVLGAPLLREAASVVHGTLTKGDPLADFNLTPSGAQRGVVGSILGRYGIGDEAYTANVGPYAATVIPARRALTEAITGQPTLTGEENDPVAEAAFRQAHPWMTTAETVEQPLGDLAFDVGLTGGLGTVKALPTLSKAPALSPAIQLLGKAGARAEEGAAFTKAGAALTQALGGEQKVAAGVRGLGHLFVPGMVAGAVESGSQAVEAAKTHPIISPEVAGPAVTAATDATFAALAGLHVFGGGRTPTGEAKASLDFDPSYRAPERSEVEVPESGLEFAETPELRRAPLEPWQDPNVPATFDTGGLELDPGWRRAPTPDTPAAKLSKADRTYLASLGFEEAPSLRDVAAREAGGTIHQPPPGTEEIGPPPAPGQELIFKAPLREPPPETLEAAATTAGVPFLIPKKDLQALADLGYDQAARDALKPEEAQQILAEQRRAPGAATPPPQVPPTSAPRPLGPQPTPELGRPEQLTLPTAEEFAAESAAAKATAPPSLQVPPGARNKPAAPELAPEPVQTEFPEAAAAREAANQAMAARQAEVAAKRREAITTRLQEIKTHLDVLANVGKAAKGKKRGDPIEFLSREDQATVKSLRAEQLALRQEWNTGAKETRSPRQIALAEAKARREAGARNLPPVEEVAPDVPKEELDLMLSQAAGDLARPLTPEDRARLRSRLGDEGGPSGNRASKKGLYGLQELPDRPAVIARAIREDGDNPLYLQAKHLIAKNLQEGREGAADRMKGELEEPVPEGADTSFNPEELEAGGKKEAAPAPVAEAPAPESGVETITLTPAQEKLANELGLSDDALALFFDTTENFERELANIADPKARLNLIAARRKFLGGDLEPGGKEEKYGKLTAEEAKKAAQGRSTVEPSKLQSGEGLLGRMKAKGEEPPPPPSEEPPAAAPVEPPPPPPPPTSPAAAAKAVAEASENKPATSEAKGKAKRGRDLATIEEEILWAAREGKDLKPLLAERAKQLRVMGMPLEEGPLLARDLYDRLPKAAQKRLGKPPGADEKFSTTTAETPQSFTSVVDQLRSSMGPNIDRVTPLEERDGVRVTFKGGREVDLLRNGNIRIIPDPSGPKVVAGSHQVIDGRSLVELHEGRADFVTLLHELGHGALSELLLKTGGFSSGERTELFRANGFNLAKMGPKERAAAEEVVVQKLAEDASNHAKRVMDTGTTKGTPGWFRRVWNYITNLVTAFKAPEYQKLVEYFASGGVFNRGVGERLARAAGERFREFTGGSEEAAAAPEPVLAEQLQARAPVNLQEATAAVKAAEEALAAAGAQRRSSNEDVEYRAARQALAAAREAQKEFLRGNKVAPIKVVGRSQEAPQPDLVGQPTGPGGPTPKQIEHRVEYLRDLEQSYGIKTARLSRNYPQTSEKIGAAATKILETKTTDEIFRDERPDTSTLLARQAILTGRKAHLEQIAKEVAYRVSQGEEVGDLQIQGSLASLKYFGEVLAADTHGLLVKDIKTRTEMGRAFRALGLLTTPAEGDVSTFLRMLFKKIPNISEAAANKLAAMALKGEIDDLPDAIHAAVNPPLWRKFLEGWKSGLVSAVGTLGFANPGGNIGELLARTIETEVARPLDWLAEKAGLGERTRSGDEAVAERQAVRETLGPAMRKLITEDLGKIWRGEEWRPTRRTAHELLDEVPAIGPGYNWVRKLLPNGHLGKTVRIPLEILGATDVAFRNVALKAEMAKLSTRAARQELGPKATSQAIQAKAAEIMAEALGATTSRGTRISDQAAAQAQLRVFQGDPDHVVRAIEQLRSKLSIFHVALPFTRTPWNIFKLMIERSPAGGYSAVKAWYKFKQARREGVPLADQEALRDKALDLSARAALGSVVMVTFLKAAQAGLMTGNGPTDPKRRKALMDTGWQPYSFKVGETYIPFNRFEPVSSILGFAADAAELGHLEKGESYLKKAAAAFMTNALSKTYLQGLSEAAGVVVDPERYGPGYAANLAGSLVPNIVAKGAQAIDPVLRETNAPDEGVLGQIGRTIQSRLPGASTLLPERRTSTGDVAQRTGLTGVPGALSRFALPVQVSTARPGKELEAEFSRVGYVPPIPDREIRVGGQSLTLGATEHQKLLEEYRKADTRAAHLMASPSYQAAPDDGPPGVRNKTAMLQRIYNDANTRFRARYAGIFKRRALAQAAAQAS